MIQYLNYNTPENSFLAGYVECALWSSTDENDASLDRFGVEDINDQTYNAMMADCLRFQNDNAELLSIYYQTVQRVDDAPVEAYAGHDFWLSRNGHGAGFFDRDGVTTETRELLQLAAEKYGIVDLYIGDDGEIYQ